MSRTTAAGAPWPLILAASRGSGLGKVLCPEAWRGAGAVLVDPQTGRRFVDEVSCHGRKGHSRARTASHGRSARSRKGLLRGGPSPPYSLDHRSVQKCKRLWPQIANRATQPFALVLCVLQLARRDVVAAAIGRLPRCEVRTAIDGIPARAVPAPYPGRRCLLSRLWVLGRRAV